MNIIENLKLEFNKPLPGEESQFEMATGNRVFYNEIKNSSEPKQASVLIILYFKSYNLHTVFIERAISKGPHSQQMAFPGGMYEDNDCSLYNTALREASEEIGLIKANVKYIGRLTSLYVPISNVLVSPFVVYIENLQEFSPNFEEVAEIAFLNVNEFLEPKNISSFEIKFRDKPYSAPCFNIDKYKIWGATAMIWNEFLTIYKKVI